MNGCEFGNKIINRLIINDLIAEVKKINVEFDFDNKNNELHFNVFDNEEYVIGIFSDGFFINRVDHYTLYLSNMKSVLDFIKNNLK